MVHDRFYLRQALTHRNPKGSAGEHHGFRVARTYHSVKFHHLFQAQPVGPVRHHTVGVHGWVASNLSCNRTFRQRPLSIISSRK